MLNVKCPAFKHGKNDVRRSLLSKVRRYEFMLDERSKLLHILFETQPDIGIPNPALQLQGEHWNEIIEGNTDGKKYPDGFFR